MRPFPQPIWLVPYYAMSLRYGDSTRRGNAILINDGGIENALRVASQGYRIIIDPNDYDTRYRASIVAYYIHAQSLSELESKVKSTDDRIKNQSIIEAPVIVYYDAPQFPIQALSSLDRRTHWISIQCYRQATESLSAFRDRVNSQVNSISHAGFYQLPTWNFYTLNGTVSEEFITDTFQFIRPLFDDYKVIGLLAFADMRPTGMVDNPRIAAFFEELEDAVLDAPNRYTGWMSRFTNPDEQLKNILSQDKAQFVLSKEQTDYIKSFLGSKPVVELPNEFAVVQDIYQKWKPLTSEIHAHLFVRDVAATLRMKDKNWGMITKNPGENQCTEIACGTNVHNGLGVDVIAYKFPDGTHQNVDILNSFGPGATPSWHPHDPSTNRPGNNWTDDF